MLDMIQNLYAAGICASLVVAFFFITKRIRNGGKVSRWICTKHYGAAEKYLKKKNKEQPSTD